MLVGWEITQTRHNHFSLLGKGKNTQSANLNLVTMKRHSESLVLEISCLVSALINWVRVVPRMLELTFQQPEQKSSLVKRVSSVSMVISVIRQSGCNIIGYDQ